jgi:hypothetical protein
MKRKMADRLMRQRNSAASMSYAESAKGSLLRVAGQRLLRFSGSLVREDLILGGAFYMVNDHYLYRFVFQF